MIALLPYEKQLNLDLPFAMSEGSRHFEENSAVQDALRRITHRLNELGIALPDSLRPLAELVE